MHGSLRRLENGQLDIIRAINGIPGDVRADLVRELRRGNEKPLMTALRSSGVSKHEIKNNIEVAKTYVTASAPDQVRIESQVRSRSSLDPHSRVQGNKYKTYEFGEHIYTQPSHKYRDPPSASTSSPIHRRHSANNPNYRYDGSPPLINPYNRSDHGPAKVFSNNPVPPRELFVEQSYGPQPSIAHRRASDTSTRPDPTPCLIFPPRTPTNSVQLPTMSLDTHTGGHSIMMMSCSCSWNMNSGPQRGLRAEVAVVTRRRTRTIDGEIQRMIAWLSVRNESR